ncbi:MAG: AAA family ATPase [Cellvibrionaceae bacterium]
MNDQTSDQFQQAAQKLQELSKTINSRLIGQQDVVHQVLMSLLSNGHVLLEGVPGLGKTLLVTILANCFGGKFKRIQFTPDLMPSDITGHAIYDMNNHKFNLHKGPVFTNLLLADEINRAPAKSQAALLEVMQEKQVTIEGKPIPVPLPFMVLATQNPLEQEGTYPLPEAQLDRFFMKVMIEYPSLEDETRLTQAITGASNTGNDLSALKEPLISGDDVIQLQQLTAAVTTDEQVVDYAVRIVRQTRDYSAIYRGAGSRACIDLVKCAKAYAFLEGRQYVLPDDIKAVTLPVVRHRIALTPDIEIEGMTSDDVLNKLLTDVEAPRV